MIKELGRFIKSHFTRGQEKVNIKHGPRQLSPSGLTVKQTQLPGACSMQAGVHAHAHARK